MRAKSLLHRINDSPFKGFRVQLSDGSSIPVTQGGMIIVGPSSAVLPTEFGTEEGERVVTDGERLHFLAWFSLPSSMSRSSENHRRNDGEVRYPLGAGGELQCFEVYQ